MTLNGPSLTEEKHATGAK